jgi:hypothetical protein
MKIIEKENFQLKKDLLQGCIPTITFYKEVSDDVYRMRECIEKLLESDIFFKSKCLD